MQVVAAAGLFAAIVHARDAFPFLEAAACLSRRVRGQQRGVKGSGAGRGSTVKIGLGERAANSSPPASGSASGVGPARTRLSSGRMARSFIVTIRCEVEVEVEAGEDGASFPQGQLRYKKSFLLRPAFHTPVADPRLFVGGYGDIHLCETLRITAACELVGRPCPSEESSIFHAAYHTRLVKLDSNTTYLQCEGGGCQGRSSVL